jgi:hypothetical protein
MTAHNHLTPRTPSKPFFDVGNYAVLWYNKEFKHVATELSELNRIDLIAQSNEVLKRYSTRHSFVIVLVCHSSLTSPWCP